MLRSLFALIAGYLVFAIAAGVLFGVSGRDPHADAPAGFKIFSVAYGAIFAFLAGYTAAALAARKPSAHAAAVAAILMLAAAGSWIASRGLGSAWTEIATIVVSAPLTVAGGMFFERRRGL